MDNIKERFLTIYAAFCILAFASWSQSFVVWLFILACRRIATTGSFHSEGGKLFILAVFVQVINLPFFVWAVMKFLHSLFKYPKAFPTLPQKGAGITSDWKLLISLACLVVLLVTAVVCATFFRLSSIPRVIVVMFRIAMGLTIPLWILTIIVVLCKAFKEKKDKEEKVT